MLALRSRYEKTSEGKRKENLGRLFGFHVGDSFGSTYGPLGGVFALLLWSLFSSIALFYGTALCAQLEAVRSGHPEPAYDDPGRPHEAQVDGSAI